VHFGDKDVEHDLLKVKQMKNAEFDKPCSQARFSVFTF